MAITKALHTLRYNANTILSESRASTANINNYDYLLNLSKRMLAIEEAIYQIELVSPSGIRNEPVANIVANSIHRTVVALIPSYGIGDFDWEGAGEDMALIVGNAWGALSKCDEDGLAQAVCDKYNLFQTMCEIQAGLDEHGYLDCE
jgi:hypothetical protein